MSSVFKKWLSLNNKHNYKYKIYFGNTVHVILHIKKYDFLTNKATTGFQALDVCFHKIVSLDTDPWNSIQSQPLRTRSSSPSSINGWSMLL